VEILKKCSLVTCPMRATNCNYILDFNPIYDKVRSEWDRQRGKAKQSTAPDRAAVVAKLDQEFLADIEPILTKDINLGIVRCKADIEVTLSKNLSLEEISQTFGITRPRIQQIEARAEQKIAEEKASLSDYLLRGGQ